LLINYILPIFFRFIYSVLYTLTTLTVIWRVILTRQINGDLNQYSTNGMDTVGKILNWASQGGDPLKPPPTNQYCSSLAQFHLFCKYQYFVSESHGASATTRLTARVAYAPPLHGSQYSTNGMDTVSFFIILKDD